MYNREILIIITSDTFIKLLLNLKNTKNIKLAKEVNNIFRKAERIVDNNTGDILFYWKHYRYDVFASMFLNDFFNHLDGYEYKIIILGDDLDDIEEDGHLYNVKFNPHIIKEIDFNRE